MYNDYILTPLSPDNKMEVGNKEYNPHPLPSNITRIIAPGLSLLYFKTHFFSKLLESMILRKIERLHIFYKNSQ